MSDPRKPKFDDGGVATEVDQETKRKTQKKLQRPKLYKVLLLNDDYTTMEFVVALLIHVFHHDESSAQAIMLHIHTNGVGIAGVYTYEVAETKVATVMELAEKAEFPLQCTLEPADDDEGGHEDRDKP
ncbi:MAG TPA: ATP-dependent Clp protease adaptor ClpS [Polyangia bacterium]|nr:ATP-dependent Clp protease adaptor ClpS [Polyangia bacterium]